MCCFNKTARKITGQDLEEVLHPAKPLKNLAFFTQKVRSFILFDELPLVSCTPR